MRRPLAGGLLALWLILGLSSAPSAQTPIGAILGGSLACDPLNQACVGFPTQLTALCNNIIGGANCPTTFHPSWTDSTRFWGSFGSDCVTSTNQGVTWSLCTTQPFTGVGVQVAGTTNGNVVAVASVAGACTLKLSTDNGTSWTTQFTDTTSCVVSVSSSQMIRCQPTLGRCDFVHVVTDSKALQSNDNGVSWTLTTTVDIQITAVNSLQVDNSNGLTGGIINNARKLSLETLSVWGVSAGWPGAAINYATSTAYFHNSVPQTLTYDLAALNYKRLSSAGLIQQTFTPIGAQTTGSPVLAGLELTPGSAIKYVVGCISNGQAFWISADDLVSTVLLASNTQGCGIATMYALGGRIFIAVKGVAGSFYRIS